MIAIRTKYLGPTDTRGARIRATGGGRSITRPYDYAANREERHAAVARALARKLGWRGDLIEGSIADGYVYVFADGARYVDDAADSGSDGAR
jgi:hypothetical protein